MDLCNLDGMKDLYQSIYLSEETVDEGNGLYANIHAKRARGERPARPGEKDYPAKGAFEKAEKTAKEEFDFYDAVLEYLCVEGYAEDLEDAESIMVYLEPEAVQAIAESGWHRRNPEKIGTSADPDVRMSRSSSVARNSASKKSPERTAKERKSDRRVLYNYYGEGGKKTAIERAKAERDAARKRRSGK